MTVTTNTTHLGETVVTIRGGITDKINVYFHTRAEACAFLKALRKRAR